MVFTVATIVSLLVAEAVLQLVSTPVFPSHHQIFCEYDSLLGWKKIPSFTGLHRTIEYEIEERINSLGLRGPEISITPPAGVKRVLFLGDSFTEGYTVEYEHLFTTLLERKMNEMCPDSIQVINAGTGGYSTDQELLYFENYGRLFQPDVVVLMFCTNDVWYNGQPSYWRGYKPYFEKTDTDSLILRNVPVPLPQDMPAIEKVKTWLLLHSRLVQKLNALKNMLLPEEKRIPDEWRIYRVHPSEEMERCWQITESLLARLSKEVSKAGARLLVFYIPEKVEIDENAWNQLLRTYRLEPVNYDPHQPANHLERLCEKLGVDLIVSVEDFERKQQQQPDKPLYYQIDYHWNEAGHALVSELLWRRIGCP